MPDAFDQLPLPVLPWADDALQLPGVTPARVIVTGSRDWVWRDVLYDTLNCEIDVGSIVVHGGCPTGVDAMTHDWCTTQPDITEQVFAADWDAYGKSAGPRRNQAMVDAGADLVLGFPLAGSRGTQDCLRKARRAGIQCIIYGPSGRVLNNDEED